MNWPHRLAHKEPIDHGARPKIRPSASFFIQLTHACEPSSEGHTFVLLLCELKRLNEIVASVGWSWTLWVLCLRDIRRSVVDGSGRSALIGSMRVLNVDAL